MPTWRSIRFIVCTCRASIVSSRCQTSANRSHSLKSTPQLTKSSLRNCFSEVSSPAEQFVVSAIGVEVAFLEHALAGDVVTIGLGDDGVNATPRERTQCAECFGGQT